MKEGATLSPEAAAKLLGRLMLAWDGQWFLKTAEACGLETAVRLNAKVRTSFGRIEMREYMKAAGRGPATDLEEAVAVMDGYRRAFLADGMAAEWHVEGPGRVRVRVSRCVPQEGAGRAGLRPDTPCVACESLWGAWLETAMPGSAWKTTIACSLGRGGSGCDILVERLEVP